MIETVVPIAFFGILAITSFLYVSNRKKKKPEVKTKVIIEIKKEGWNRYQPDHYQPPQSMKDFEKYFYSLKPDLTYWYRTLGEDKMIKQYNEAKEKP